ncbi:hypothetical protein CRYUN_Cryun38cG0016600 [Craigia yunnanensis]
MVWLKIACLLYACNLLQVNSISSHKKESERKPVNTPHAIEVFTIGCSDRPSSPKSVIHIFHRLSEHQLSSVFAPLKKISDQNFAIQIVESSKAGWIVVTSCRLGTTVESTVAQVDGKEKIDEVHR